MVNIFAKLKRSLPKDQVIFHEIKRLEVKKLNYEYRGETDIVTEARLGELYESLDEYYRTIAEKEAQEKAEFEAALKELNDEIPPLL